MILGFPKRIRIQGLHSVFVPFGFLPFQSRFKGRKDIGENPDMPLTALKTVQYL